MECSYYNLLNPKTKHKLLEVIQTARVKLTINTEINISIDDFGQELDKDLIMVLTKDKFEELINDYLEDFRKYLQTIIKIFEIKGITIEFVELAGQLMLTLFKIYYNKIILKFRNVFLLMNGLVLVLVF